LKCQPRFCNRISSDGSLGVCKPAGAVTIHDGIVRAVTAWAQLAAELDCDLLGPQDICGGSCARRLFVQARRIETIPTEPKVIIRPAEFGITGKAYLVRPPSCNHRLCPSVRLPALREYWALCRYAISGPLDGAEQYNRSGRSAWARSGLRPGCL
jgi:hypothetical protein